MTDLAENSPSVTVLMPVFNGARYLRDQVDTILGQQGVDVRLVVLDDGSSDNSLAILKNIAAHDPRVSVLDQRSNAGLVTAVSRLLEVVETPYFAMSDQDDLWDSNKLLASIEHLEKTEAALIYSDVRLCDERGTVIEPSYILSRGIAPLEGADPIASIFRNPVIGHTIVGRRNVALAAGSIPSNLRYYEPWLVAVACNSGGVSMRKEQLGRYRVHTANVVGPQQRRRELRISQLRAHISKRQTNRVSALRAVGCLRNDVEVVARMYDYRGLRRIYASFLLVRTLRDRCPQIGRLHIYREALLLLWPRMAGDGS
ncbi:glycosyltransferase [Mycolicibacterium sp. A43C]